MTASHLPAELRRMLYGFRASECIHAATVLGIADLLQEGPKSCQELATGCGTDAHALRRLLRALAGLGIFRENETGRFALTPLADLLRKEAEGSLRAEILNTLHPTSRAPWGELLGSLRSGRASFPAVFGTDVWSYRAENPEAGAVFDAWASENARRQNQALIGALDVSGIELLVDVGGGTAEVMAGILGAHPGLRGVVFDLPRVLGDAEKVVRAAGVFDRCRMVAGDFFQDVPAQGDLYLMKAVLHNWNDEAAAAILRSCRRAMAPRAKLVAVESVLEPSGPPRENFLDLHMLVMHGGRERTAGELEALFEASGMRLGKITATGVGISLIEAQPV